MDRRKFLGFFSAAAAALTVAKSAVGSAPPKAASPSAPNKKTTPRVAITADTSGFTRNLSDAERMIREEIKKCRVVSCEHEFSVGDLHRLRVVYSNTAQSSPMDVKVAKATANARIVNCSVSHSCDETDNESPQTFTPKAFRGVRLKREIEVTWLLVP